MYDHNLVIFVFSFYVELCYTLHLRYFSLYLYSRLSMCILLLVRYLIHSNYTDFAYVHITFVE